MRKRQRKKNIKKYGAQWSSSIVALHAYAEDCHALRAMFAPMGEAMFREFATAVAALQ